MRCRKWDFFYMGILIFHFSYILSLYIFIYFNLFFIFHFILFICMYVYIYISYFIFFYIFLHFFHILYLHISFHLISLILLYFISFFYTLFFLYSNLVDFNMIFEPERNWCFCQDFVSMEKEGGQEFRSLELREASSLS